MNGILIHATVFLESEDDTVVTDEPVYIDAETLDSAIASGSLQAGAFNNIRVTPPPGLWPERWQFLKTQE